MTRTRRIVLIYVISALVLLCLRVAGVRINVLLSSLIVASILYLVGLLAGDYTRTKRRDRLARRRAESAVWSPTDSER